jgi:hypothetical protein
MDDVTAMPRDENPTPADVLRTHRTVCPDARRSNMARQLYFNTRTLSLIDVLHVPGCTMGLYALDSRTSIPQLAYGPDSN